MYDLCLVYDTPRFTIRSLHDHYSPVIRFSCYGIHRLALYSTLPLRLSYAISLCATHMARTMTLRASSRLPVLDGFQRIIRWGWRPEDTHPKIRMTIGSADKGVSPARAGHAETPVAEFDMGRRSSCLVFRRRPCFLSRRTRHVRSGADVAGQLSALSLASAPLPRSRLLLSPRGWARTSSPQRSECHPPKSIAGIPSWRTRTRPILFCNIRTTHHSFVLRSPRLYRALLLDEAPAYLENKSHLFSRP